MKNIDIYGKWQKVDVAMFLRILFARGMNMPSNSVFFSFDKISYIKILWTKESFLAAQMMKDK